MKKFFCALLTASLVLISTACSVNNSSDGSQSASQTSTPESTVSVSSTANTNEEETWNQVQKAYTYALPLVMTHLTKLNSTNVKEPDNNAHAPVNQLIHAQSLATAKTKFVVTPNVDTVYTQAWLDLSKEPMLFTLPKTDRFLNAQILDAWTNTPASLTEEGTYAFVTPNWNGTLPEGVKKVEVPTNTVWIITRVLLNGADDLQNIIDIQSQMSLIPLSAYQSEDTYVPEKGTVKEENTFVPVEKLRSMSIEEYFNTANELMVDNPPADADKEFLDSVAALNIGAGKTFDKSVLPGDVDKHYQSMTTSLVDTLKKESAEYFIKLGNWDYYGDPIANFGTAYSYRALIAMAGLGANPTSVAIYPRTDIDIDGNQLNGKNTYTLHFDSLPPVKELGFWSVTAYGSDNFLIDNPIDRYSINDRSDFKLNDDGSLDITISAEKPENEDNWLPVSTEDFHLHLRVYYPNSDALENWTAPTITKQA